MNAAHLGQVSDEAEQLGKPIYLMCRDNRSSARCGRFDIRFLELIHGEPQLGDSLFRTIANCDLFHVGTFRRPNCLDDIQAREVLPTSVDQIG